MNYYRVGDDILANLYYLLILEILYIFILQIHLRINFGSTPRPQNGFAHESPNKGNVHSKIRYNSGIRRKSRLRICQTTI